MEDDLDFQKWKTTETFSKVKDILDIFKNGRRPELFLNGRRPQFFQNGRQPQSRNLF
jgi:hypothetical protein